MVWGYMEATFNKSCTMEKKIKRKEKLHYLEHTVL